jgi:phospholipid/cholesterol/gamma-HCH transport system substrate-binding protein
MPRTRSLAWSELKIGALTITAVGIAALTIFMLTGGRGFFWQRYKLKTRFDSVAGLKRGSPVRVAGVEVGSVTDVELIGDKVDVTLEINKRHRERITSGSTASIGSVSLLGENAVDITPSTKGTPIPDWEYIPQSRPKAQLADVADAASQGVQEITSLVHDVREGRGTVGKLMTDDQLYLEMHRFVATAHEVTRGIQQGRGSIGKLLNDPRAAEALETSLRSIDEMMRRINAGQGSLGKLLRDDAFSRSLTGATSNLEALSARLNRGEGTAGKLMTDTALYNRLNSLSDRFDQLINHLNEGQGTAGQLLNNKELYENMNRAVGELRGLVADIRRDPKKFLNVKVSIF